MDKIDDRLITNEECVDLLKRYPKQLFLISPEGEKFEYTIPYGEHHYQGYLKILDEIIQKQAGDCVTHLMNLREKYQLEIKQFDRLRDTNLKGQKSELYFVGQKLRSALRLTLSMRNLLIENYYFIIETYIDEKSLTQYYSFFYKDQEFKRIQQDIINEVCLNLDIDSFEPVTSDDHLFTRNIWQYDQRKSNECKVIK